MIYLDNNATTQVHPAAREAMLPFLAEEYGNPSSSYELAYRAQDAILKAHEQTARLIGAKPGEIIMTSCGTESNAAAFYSAIHTQPAKSHIVTTAVEHLSVLNLARHFGGRGYTVHCLGVDAKGRIDLAGLRELLARKAQDIALASIMFANNETGALFPIAAIGAMCREHGILFHTDAVQAVGKVPIDLEELPVDMLSLSGHKIHAPKGVGALYVRQGTPFAPLLIGGHQEYGRRAGTQAVPNIVALGQACELAEQHLAAEGHTRIAQLRDYVQTRLQRAIPDAIVNGDEDNRAPNTLSMAFKGAASHEIVEALARREICVSSGSACTEHERDASHVMRAMNIPQDYADGVIRISLSELTRRDELDAFVDALSEVMRMMRR